MLIYVDQFGKATLYKKNDLVTFSSEKVHFLKTATTENVDD